MSKGGKKFYFIYKTTNLINEKYYIGMHSTNNLNDGYLGSGKKLWYSIKKYGKENFKVEILEFLNDRISLQDREKEIVTKDLLKDDKCLNLKEGGDIGGFFNEEHRKKCQAAGGRSVRILLSKRHQDRFKNDINYRNSIISKLKGNRSWLNKKHKEETKRKIGLTNSIKQKGCLNSQYGTHWITNGEYNKKIRDKEKLPDGWSFGRITKINYKN